MDRGSYVAASAGLANLLKLDVVNNNLANVNTPGFKGQVIMGDVQTFDQTLASRVAETTITPYAQEDHERNPGVTNLRTATDFSVGAIRNTGNPLDAALRDANDFFVLQGQDGEQLYTRAGNFTLRADGTLTAQDGTPVFGAGGPITANEGRISIDGGGRVLSDGEEIGRLQVVRFENTDTLERVAGVRFRQSGDEVGQTLDSPEIEPQALEMSNVSAIRSVIDLMSASKGFELYTKSAKAIDELNETAIQRVGRKG